MAGELDAVISCSYDPAVAALRLFSPCVGDCISADVVLRGMPSPYSLICRSRACLLGLPVHAVQRMSSLMPIVMRASRRAGARQFRTFDAAFTAHMQHMQQQVLDCARKADYMTLVRRMLRQSRTLPLPMGVPTDLRQARKDLVRESGVYLNDELHRMGGDDCVTSFERKLFRRIKELIVGGGGEESRVAGDGGVDGQSADGGESGASGSSAGTMSTNVAEDIAMLQGIVHSIIIALSRTVLGGDAYARCSELFNNPNMVVLTSESQLAPPLRIEITKGRITDSSDGSRDRTLMTSNSSRNLNSKVAAATRMRAESLRGNAVEVLGTICIESVDVIKVSHFDIQHLMDEPEIWLLLRAAVVQSFEILRPRARSTADRNGGVGSGYQTVVKVAPTFRTTRNITITSHRANILSLADFGLVGIHATQGATGSRRTSARRRKMKSQMKTAQMRRTSALANDITTSPKNETIRKMADGATNSLKSPLASKHVKSDIESCPGPLKTDLLVSL